MDKTKNSEIIPTMFLRCLYECYDIKPVRTKEGKSFWKIPLGDDDATREK